eukprot:TRINITY_DN4023_c0_g1_i1.p1 TRINITY_DN4023_c0_g1~~TRINITY_DN4023_c0_g1_i1.p1  ORF type:complete len:516 (+),score=173.91 TRINITY_DN4023_c0_g1_i1:56-1603(+)
MSMSECLYEAVSLDYVDSHWIVVLSLILLCLSILSVYILIVANLYRTPWSSSMTISLDDNHFNSDSLLQFQEESPDVLDVCERCGNDSDLHEVSKTSTGVLVLCAGCICYKTFLRSILPQVFLIFSAFIGWFFGFAMDFFLIDVEIAMCLFLQLFIFVITAIRFPSIFKYIFSLRQSSSSGEGDSKFLRLNRILGDKTNSFIEKAHKSHIKPLKDILIDGEEILWLEPVSLKSFLKHNRSFHIMLWFICGLPLMWAVIGAYYALKGFHWDCHVMILGLLITIFAFALLLPILVSSLVKCRVTYAVTNYRALRVNTTPFWFANRVYSFPVFRMSFLHIFTFPNSFEGKVSWLVETDEDAFTQFEYVTCTSEVEEVFRGLRSVATNSESNSLREDLEMTTRHLHIQSNGLAALQLVPLLGVIVAWFVLYSLDYEKLDISIFPIPPCLWLTVLLHLAWRKVNFLTKCTSNFLAFTRDPLTASSHSIDGPAAPQTDYEFDKAIADEDVHTLDSYDQDYN